jgi:hypothetical protein
MDEVGQRLARLCAQAEGDELRQRAVRYGVGAALDRLRKAVESGARGGSVAADLDALDDAFARHGIDGLTVGPRAFEPLRGSHAHPVVTVWGCPAAVACARLEPQEPPPGDRPAAAPDDPPPWCGLAAKPLISRRFRL